MKGLAIDNLASTPPLRKKSLTNATHNLSIAIPKGFQDNLLANSLTSKLKQRRNNERNHNVHNNKENASRIISAKPPKQARKSSLCVKTDINNNNSALGLRAHDDSPTGFGNASRTGSGVDSELRRATDGRRHRVDSATSDKLPRLSAGGKDGSSSRASRRTNSADPFLGVGFYSGSIGSGRMSRISASTSFYPSTDSTGLAFDSSGADYTIKVIKRDGVFQPIDKYAPGRQMSRDQEHGSRGIACDYEVFTLPICEDTAASRAPTGSPSSHEKYHNLPVSRGGKSDASKKSMKVSWCTVMENENPPPGGPHEGMDSRMDANSTPVASFTTTSRPNNCKDTMAFRRPVYSSGRSGIKSIGVKWTVPTVASADREDENAQRQLPSACSSSSTKPPMWSWLVTPEPTTNNNNYKKDNKQNEQQKPRQRSSTRVKSVGQLSRASKSKESPSPSSSIGRSTSMFDIRTQHCRDVHPVATAMDRQGTSVTKTKWKVPSSNSSTLDAKQVAMERLQMVKRPGKKIVGHRDEFGHSILRYQQEQQQQNGEEDHDEGEDYNQDVDYNHMIEEYKEAILLAGDEGLTTSTTTRRDDTNSSPTKSVVSTFH